MKRPLSPSVNELLDRLRSALAGRRDVAFAYLFGSRAIGRAQDASDVDIAVMPCGDLAAADADVRIRRLAPPLVSAAGDTVDLVFLDRANPLLAHRVIRDGLIICEADPVARVRFHVRTIAIYLDTQPMRTEQIRQTRARALEGRTVGRPRDPRTAHARLGRPRA